MYFILLAIYIFALYILYTVIALNTEHFGSSTGGALIQLMAKDSQDNYLTGGYNNNVYLYNGRYVPYYPYGRTLWNNPVRTQYYYNTLYYNPVMLPWYYIFQ